MQDTFRKEYKPLNDQQKDLMARVKAKAEELETLFGEALLTNPDGRPTREAALAKTNLEQAIMWAVKGITS